MPKGKKTGAQVPMIVDAPRPRGGQTIRTREIEDEIVRRLGRGEPMRVICRDEHLPHWNTVYDWMDADEEFAGRIAHARERGHDAIAEEAMEISDTPLLGQRVERDARGMKVVQEDMLGHRRLQVETRLKLLAKWNPKKYGDRQQVDMNGRLDVGDMTTEEIRAEIAALAAKGILAGTDGGS